MPLAVMLRSMAANLCPRRRVDVQIVADGLDCDLRARVSSALPPNVSVHWTAPQRAGFVELPLWGRMTISTYDKLALGRWLPSSVARALWLDCDLLVLDDVAKLWETPNGPHCVLAAQDGLVRTFGARFGVAGRHEMRIDNGAEYFNAGVMLIDVARWRDEDVAGRALAYLQKHRREVFFWDQEALNAALAGNWGKLDPRWNWSPGSTMASDLSPSIIHFTGGLKPWRLEGHSARQKLYYQYLDATAWAGWRPARNWRSMLLSHYEGSRLRSALFPLECFKMKVERAMTLRYVTADPASGPLEKVVN